MRWLERSKVSTETQSSPEEDGDSPIRLWQIFSASSNGIETSLKETRGMIKFNLLIQINIALT
jgi:hypothetical protein